MIVDTKRRFGIVDCSGRVCYSNKNLSEVRAFLRSAGLGWSQLDGYGWEGNGRRGVINYVPENGGGSWIATWWDIEAAKAAAA